MALRYGSILDLLYQGVSYRPAGTLYGVDYYTYGDYYCSVRTGMKRGYFAYSSARLFQVYGATGYGYRQAGGREGGRRLGSLRGRLACSMRRTRSFSVFYYNSILRRGYLGGFPNSFTIYSRCHAFGRRTCGTSCGAYSGNGRRFLSG